MASNRRTRSTATGKKKSSGATKKAGARKRVTSRTKSIDLSEEQKQVFSPLRDEKENAKKQLADLQIRIMHAESDRLTLVQKIMELDGRILQEAKGVIASFGIDPEDPSQGKWNLDFEQGVINRLD